MLAHIPHHILLFLLVTIPLIAVIVIISGSIWGFIKMPGKATVILISIFSLIIAAASWIFNMGWIRFMMTLTLIPFIHAMIFFLTNLFTARYIDESQKLKILNLLFCITYMISYIFLPDGADTGGLYFFFGLIHNSTLSYVAQAISYIAFFAHIILFVMQIIQWVKQKKKATM